MAKPVIRKWGMEQLIGETKLIICAVVCCVGESTAVDYINFQRYIWCSPWSEIIQSHALKLLDGKITCFDQWNINVSYRCHFQE